MYRRHRPDAHRRYTFPFLLEERRLSLGRVQEYGLVESNTGRLGDPPPGRRQTPTRPGSLFPPVPWHPGPPSEEHNTTPDPVRSHLLGFPTPFLRNLPPLPKSLASEALHPPQWSRPAVTRLSSIPARASVGRSCRAYPGSWGQLLPPPTLPASSPILLGRLNDKASPSRAERIPAPLFPFSGA